MASFERVLEREREFIHARRRALQLPLDAPTCGVAYSGGGIRSAAFACGALQALAARNELAHIDYLSSVSGGGYTASSYVTRLLRALKEGRNADPVRALHDTAKSTYHDMRERAGYLVDRSGTASAAACDYATFVAVVVFTALFNAAVALSPLVVIAEAIASGGDALFPVDANAVRWSTLHAALLWTTLGVLALYAGLLIASAVKPAVYGGATYRTYRTIAIAVFWLSVSLLASIIFTQTLLDHYQRSDNDNDSSAGASSTAHSVMACVGIAVLSILSPLTAAGSRQTRFSSFLGAVSFASKLFFVSWWAAGQLFLVRSHHQPLLTGSTAAATEPPTLALLRAQTLRPLCCFLAVMLIAFQPISTVLYRYCRRGLSTFHAPYPHVPLTQLAAIHAVGGPYYLCNATLNSAVHEHDEGAFGPFHFSPLYSGSPLAYYDTAVTWPQLSTIDAVTISGAAVNSAMGRYAVDLPHSLRFVWNAFGLNMGCWVPRVAPGVLSLAAVHGAMAGLLALCATADPHALWLSIGSFVVLCLVGLTPAGGWVFASAYLRMLLQSFGHAWVITPPAPPIRSLPSPVPPPVAKQSVSAAAPTAPAPSAPPNAALAPSAAPNWLYLSDGGHYENMAVLELFRRGVSRIVVLDGSEDPFDAPGELHPNAEVLACAEIKGAFQCASAHGLLTAECKAQALYILDQFARGTERYCQIPLTYTHTDVDPVHFADTNALASGRARERVKPWGVSNGGNGCDAKHSGAGTGAAAGASSWTPVLWYVKLRALPQDKAVAAATNARLAGCDRLFAFPRHSTAYQLFSPALFEAYAALGSSGIHELPAPSPTPPRPPGADVPIGNDQHHAVSDAPRLPDAFQLVAPPNAPAAALAAAVAVPAAAPTPVPPPPPPPAVRATPRSWATTAVNGLWVGWLLLFGGTRAMALARGSVAAAWSVALGTKAMRLVVGADVFVVLGHALCAAYGVWSDGRRPGICADAQRKLLSTLWIGVQTVTLLATATWLRASLPSFAVTDGGDIARHFPASAVPCAIVSVAALHLCYALTRAALGADSDGAGGRFVPFVRAKAYGAAAWAVLLLPCSMWSAAMGTGVSAPTVLVLTAVGCALYWKREVAA